MALHYQLGFCSWLLTGPLPERIAFLADCQFEAAALSQFTLKLDPGERREAAAAIREHGLALTYHANAKDHLKDGHLDLDFVKRMLDDVLFWHENAVPVRACCSDAISRLENGKRLYLPADTAELLRLKAEILSPHGICFGLENGIRRPGRPDSILKEIRSLCSGLEAVPGLGLLFDVAHANIRPDCPLDEFIQLLPFPIHEVHISDNRGEVDEHLHPGSGTVDFQALRRGLEEVRFNGIITLEFCPSIMAGRYAWNQTVPTEAQTIRAGRERFLELFNSN